MKLFPSAKLMLIGYGIALFINAGEFLKVTGLLQLVYLLLIDNVILAVIVIILLRIAIWIGEKAGIVKSPTKNHK